MEELRENKVNMDFKPNVLHESIQIKEEDVKFESECDNFSDEQNSPIKHSPSGVVEFVGIRDVKIEEIDEYEKDEDPIKINEVIDKEFKMEFEEGNMKKECFPDEANESECLASASDNQDQQIEIVVQETDTKAESFLVAANESVASPNKIQGEFICEYCKRAFTSAEYCQKHRRRCKDRVYNQPSTSATSIPDKKPRLTNDGGKLYRCDNCDNKYKSQKLLNEHLRRHSGVGLHTCTECHRQFTKPSDLARHLLIHTGEKPHKCKQCEAAFKRADSLKAHMMIHTGARPHKCTHCARTFTQSGYLITHMRTHTGDRPYQCTQCNRAFTESGSLTTHMRTHTGEKQYQCKVCSRAFTKSSTLKNHMKSHSNETSKKP